MLGTSTRVGRSTRWAVLALALHAAAAAANPLRLIGTHRLDSRLEQLTFTTPALARPTGVRVLLPAGYAAHRHRRYPVLYLLHGAAADFTSWTVKGDAEQLTARDPLIVVMPDSGAAGGYVDWYNGGAAGPPEWETYHITQLIPWIDAHLRTIARRAGRAVAGLSMGGFGAMSYAARHPELFAAVASFSGALDTNNPLDIAVTGGNVFGPRLTQEVRWRAHNPWDLAANLRGVSITIRTGNGLPGGPFGGGDIFEVAVHQMSVSFHDRLTALGIPSVWDDYGPGGHLWPYWRRDLRETLPTLMSRFTHPSPPPAAFTFTAVEPRYVANGWRVEVSRPALEFSTLRVVSRRAFELSGSGRASVITPSLYPRHQLETTTVSDATGTHELRLAPDRAGRLHVALDLGPVNLTQEYTVPAAGRARHSLTARVTVRAPR
jgi:S-formylglutathione hydrolase FrmB